MTIWSGTAIPPSAASCPTRRSSAIWMSLPSAWPDAVQGQEEITVYGDYDVDGATSAALLIRLFRSLGLTAGHYIPDRLMEGYGPSGEALVRIGEGGSKLIVTVDCGAMAYEALAQAKAMPGLEVIVVDHHKCAAELPTAFALVNPNRLDESRRSRIARPSRRRRCRLPAEAAAIIRVLRGARLFRQPPDEPKLMELLDIVALGTVADVAQAARG